MSLCAYCDDRRAVNTDHLITRNQARRRPSAQAARNRPEFKVRACFECNQAKGCLLLVPESHAHLIDELEGLTMGKYRTWDGSLKALR